MCGIAGFAGIRRHDTAETDRIIRAMTDQLAHRGPDSHGYWLDADAGTALGHRRLAIIDLSAAGHQPMASADRRWVMSYNGEVYNFRAMRREIEDCGVRLTGQSDTEVLLEWVARWGAERTLAAAEGMFAFGLWDRRERRLLLARDRVGIKPLYWCRLESGVAFASELKALLALPGFTPNISRASLATYLRYGYVPAPDSIYAGIHKLLPGSLLSVGDDEQPRVVRYWDPRAAALNCDADFENASDEALVARVGAEIERSVRQEMVSDVPLGTLLSGGIDSSLVTAVMQAASNRPVRTFSIGFDDPSVDESAHAARVAAHLGTDHTELRVSPQEALSVIGRLPQMYDEPLSDMAQIPTYLVSRLARRHVTVVLSGDGGDELFAGYERYARADRVWAALSRAPLLLRKGAAHLIDRAPAWAWSGAARISGAADSRHATRAARLAEALRGTSAVALYRSICSLWPVPNEVVLGGEESEVEAWGVGPGAAVATPGLFQLIDLQTYLPDAILAKVDRASMAVSLESRVPLLNHRLLELALRLPRRARMRDGVTKWVLRELLYRYVPRALVDRPKQGFGVPMAAWLRGPLREWADDLLSHEALTSGGLLRPEPILERWRAHRSGSVDWSYSLWAVLVFQDWQRHWQSHRFSGFVRAAV
jgi:asparagine synthase (glutamine-hydrolysing)